MCLVLREQGLRVAPNASATKLSYLLDEFDPDRDARPVLRHRRHLDRVDAVRRRSRTSPISPTPPSPGSCTGTAAVGATRRWTLLNIPPAAMPTIVDSSAVVGEATALDGAPPIAGIAGDQQASLDRSGLRAAGHGQDHVRHRRDARPRTRRRASVVRHTRRGRHVPDRCVAPRRPRHLGRRGDHAVGRHQRRVAARRPRPHRVVRRVRRGRGAVRGHRRRRVRARAARTRHARTGTTARAERCSASHAEPSARTSCEPCSKVSPTVAPT